MKKWSLGRICGLYPVLMCSVFLLGFSPQGYLYISETKFAVFAALTALFLLAFLWVFLKEKRCLKGRPEPLRLLLLGFWAWSLLSALCSPWRGMALLGGPRQDGMVTLTLYCAAFFALSEGYGGEEGPTLRITAATAMLYCLVALLQFFDLNPLWLYPGELRWSGREAEYNGAFLSLTGNADLSATVLSLGFALFWSSALKEKKWWLLIPASACFGVLLASGIRGGLVAAVFSLLICLPAQLEMGKPVRLCVYASLGIILLSSLLLLRFLPVKGTLGEVHELLNGNVRDSFGSGRVYIWKNVWELVKERPLLGGGPDTLGQRGLSFIREMPRGAVLRRVIDSAHCEYLNILVNQGACALLLFLSALGITLFRAFRSREAGVPVLRAVFVTYLIAALFSVSMPACTAFFWLCWGLLEGSLRSAAPVSEPKGSKL
ncbi:MAG: O-antigen ligase family protein [Oscillospiraceae bacterium]|nr:O-antigen ligase family protein [Oscillospiraceae bacterium]